MNKTGFSVGFTNHGYFSQSNPATFDAAIDVARKAGFDACIYDAGKLVATWSIIGGTRKVR